MPKTKKEQIVYGIMMVLVMVYGMICYNISINMGGLNNQVFLLALGDLIYILCATYIMHIQIPIILKKIIEIIEYINTK